MIVDGGGLKSSDAAKIYNDMSRSERNRAFGEEHTRQGAINMLVGESMPLYEQKNTKDTKDKDKDEFDIGEFL
jgi:hypothetical protein